MSSAPRKLPATHEFSPGQVELPEVLNLIAANQGDPKAIREAIRIKYFSAAAESYADNPARMLEEQTKRAGNVLIAMGTYGLYISSSATLTGLGETLRLEASDESRLNTFATHILKVLPGMDVVTAIKALQHRGNKVTKTSLHTELERMGYSLPAATTHHLGIVGWLRKAGVFTGKKTDYKLDEDRYEALVGVSDSAFQEFRQLGHERQKFLITLYDKAKSSPDGTSFQTKHVIDHCEFRFGKIFPKKDSLRKDLHKPLEDAGWVVFEGLSGGQGAKSGTIKATEKLLNFDRSILLEGAPDEIPPEVKAALNKNTASLLAELESTDTHIKGLALEAVAVRMVQDLGLNPIRLRERGSATGGAEVDLIADGVNLHYSRWLCQCKNKPQVNLSDLAKEVGMATLMKAHVILLVTTGTFAPTVEEYARELALGTHLQAVLISGRELKAWSKGGSAVLLEQLHIGALATRDLKMAQVRRDEAALSDTPR